MYQLLTFLHSSLRWLVLAGLIFAIYKAIRGYFQKRNFSKTDNAIRHWTATIAHIQLMVGMTLYFQSPVTRYFLKNFSTAKESFDLLFFGMIHSLIMLIAIVIITISSALTKRKPTDEEKFRTMLIGYSVAVIIIFIAIPWPFSPFANRPYFR
jgi:uncharacterized membrane protein